MPLPACFWIQDGFSTKTLGLWYSKLDGRPWFIVSRIEIGKNVYCISLMEMLFEKCQKLVTATEVLVTRATCLCLVTLATILVTVSSTVFVLVEILYETGVAFFKWVPYALEVCILHPFCHFVKCCRFPDMALASSFSLVCSSVVVPVS